MLIRMQHTVLAKIVAKGILYAWTVLNLVWNTMWEIIQMKPDVGEL